MKPSNSITELGVIMRPGMYVRRAKKSAEGDVVPNEIESTISNMKIGIKNLEIKANIGVYKHEKNVTQPLFLDIIVTINQSHKIENDDLSTTIDYDTLWQAAQNLADSAHFNLIETYVAKLGSIILKDARISHVTINAEKPQAIKSAQAAFVSIDCARS